MPWWTPGNLVLTTLLAVLVAVICRSRRIGPAGRHALWLIVLVKLVLPPVGYIGYDRFDDRYDRYAAGTNGAEAAVEGSADGARAVASAGTRPGIHTRTSLERRSSPTADVSTAVRDVISAVNSASKALSLASWTPIGVAGCALMALVQIVRVRRLVRLMALATDAPPDLTAEVEQLAARLGIRRVRTCVFPDGGTPFVWSAGRPHLFLPASLDLPPDARRALIVHELAHIRRGDHRVGWVEIVAACLWWWNPVFWWVQRHVRENAELACDGWAVRWWPGSRRAYADALVSICERASRPSAPLPAVGMSTGSRRFLERRLVMIMRNRATLKMPRAVLVTVAMLAAATAPGWAQRATTPTVSIPVIVEQPVTNQVVVRPDDVREVLPIVVASRPSVEAQVRLGLPDDAEELLGRYRTQEMEIRREAETRITEQRRSLIRELQAMQDRYTRAGALDEAVAIRSRIRTLQQQPTVRMMPAEAVRGVEGRVFLTSERASVEWSSGGGSATALGALRGRIGESIVVPVRGATGVGRVWGDRIYSDDSSIASAAVHAGVVEPEEFALVRLTILGAQDRFAGVTRNGVTSGSYGPWDGSFRVERAPRDAVLTLPEDPSLQLWSLADLRGQNGRTLLVDVTGLDDGGSVWGTDVYTDDSSLAAAAVHAGVLRPGERDVVRVTILPGRERYEGSTRHGVRSTSYQGWSGSFRVERR